VANLLQQKIIFAGSGPSFLVPRIENDRTETATKEKQEEEIEGQKVARDNFQRGVVPSIKTPFT